jgi:hypothetical protein
MISADFSLQENHILLSEISLEAAMRLCIRGTQKPDLGHAVCLPSELHRPIMWPDEPD